MKNTMNDDLWKHFGASIDMLENAITMCPENFWDTDKKFWYSAYHTLFWLDFYLTLEPSKYSPANPFTLSEFDPNGVMPDRVYSKKELLTYLQASREKLRHLLTNLTADELLNTRWINGDQNYSMFEQLLHNMRHCQHHTAQLNKLLRNEINDAPGWVVQTNHDL